MSESGYTLESVKSTSHDSIIVNGGGQIVPGEDSTPHLPRKMPITNLILLLVRVRYEKHFPAKKKAILMAAGQKCALIDEGGQRTAKYYGLINDEVEQLARELTGQVKRANHPCLCGCGKPARGKAKYASMACRKRVSRWDHPHETSDVTVKPNSGLQATDNTTEKIGQNGGSVPLH